MGLGVVAIADPPTAIRLKVPFSDGLGGQIKRNRCAEGCWNSHYGNWTCRTARDSYLFHIRLPYAFFLPLEWKDDKL